MKLRDYLVDDRGDGGGEVQHEPHKRRMVAGLLSATPLKKIILSGMHQKFWQASASRRTTSPPTRFSRSSRLRPTPLGHLVLTSARNTRASLTSDIFTWSSSPRITWTSCPHLNHHDVERDSTCAHEPGVYRHCPLAYPEKIAYTK